jgi:hypothetical protein
VWYRPGRNRYGVQGVRLNPLSLFLCTSIPCIWSILSDRLPSWTPWLSRPVSPRCRRRRRGLGRDAAELLPRGAGRRRLPRRGPADAGAAGHADDGARPDPHEDPAQVRTQGC